MQEISKLQPGFCTVCHFTHTHPIMLSILPVHLLHNVITQSPMTMNYTISHVNGALMILWIRTDVGILIIIIIILL